MSCNYTAFSPAALRNIALHCYGELKCSYWSGLRYWWNSLRFNGHFPSEPQLASVYWSKGWRRCWWQLDYWIYKSCKAPVKSSPPTYIQFFTGRMPFLSPNQQCQSTEGKNITFQGNAHPKLIWGVFQLCLWPLTAPDYLWRGLPCLSSALWCQYWWNCFPKFWTTVIDVGNTCFYCTAGHVTQFQSVMLLCCCWWYNSLSYAQLFVGIYVEKDSLDTINFLCVGCQTLLWQRLESTKTPPSSKEEKKELRKARTPVGQLDDSWETSLNKVEPAQAATAANDSHETTKLDPYAPFPDNKNPITGEICGPRGPEPTRYGDWERKGRISDFWICRLSVV